MLWFNFVQSLTCVHAQAKKLLNVILVRNKDAFDVSRADLSDLEPF